MDFGCSTLAALPARQLHRLRSVVNSAARLVYSARRIEHELYWLCVPELIDFHLAVLVYHCINGTAACYLASELRVADIESCGWMPAIFIDSFVARSTGVAQDHWRLCLPRCCCESGTCYHQRSHRCSHCRLSNVHLRRNCFADRTTANTVSNNSIDTS